MVACRWTFSSLASPNAAPPRCAASWRIIRLVRHPIKRIESDWTIRVREGWAQPDINEAVRESPGPVAQRLYAQTLAPYRERFDADQMLIGFSEDLRQDPVQFVDRCFRHIGVEAPSAQAEVPIANAAADKRVQRGLAHKLVGRPILHRVYRHSPSWLWSIGRKVLTKRTELVPRWDDVLLRDVEDEVRSDAEVLLASVGRPVDFWELSRRPIDSLHEPHGA